MTKKIAVINDLSGYWKMLSYSGDLGDRGNGSTAMSSAYGGLARRQDMTVIS